MNIEQEVFKRVHPEPELLLKYGFKKRKEGYVYQTDFMDNFLVEIVVNDEVKGKVIDKDFDEEYTNFRLEGKLGAYASRVREEYIMLLERICVECFRRNFFAYPQSNRIAQYCIDTYKTKPEFLFEDDDSTGVFRHKRSKKWYGIIMNINRKKLDAIDEDVEVMNVKVDPLMIAELVKIPGFYEAYHMNKKNWISIMLNDTVDDAVVESLIDLSFSMVETLDEWIIPANPQYYDIFTAFKQQDTILWKQSSRINEGDLVYIYVGAPYSCVMFCCEAVEVDIEYSYEDKNLKMNRAMKLHLIKQYPKGLVSFERLSAAGIKSIRGPRKLTKQASALLRQ